MPGSFFTIRCPGCGTVHTVHTGAGAFEGQPWAYEQLVCSRCSAWVSRADPDFHNVYPPNCDDCGGELEAWEGRVWLEHDAEGHVGPEHVEGPCPRCGAIVTLENAETVGLWD